MKVTENSTYRLMQTNLDRITNQLLVLRTQGSTGLKVVAPSDDTSAIRPILTTRSQLRESERYIETMGQTADKMAATDGYIDQVENVLVSVKETAINAVNGALSDSDMETLADKVAELRKELLDTSNAVVDGKYIFAGYEEDTKPFVENPAYDPDLYDANDISTWPYLYKGDMNATQLEITPGEYVEANITGNELFFGITNQIENGSVTLTQGETMMSNDLTANGWVDDITVTPEGGTPVVIPGTTDLAGETNYAQKVADSFNVSGTGLVATAGAAKVNLGAVDLGDFTTGDTYELSLSAGSTAPTNVSVSLDGSNYDFSLDGLAAALGDSAGATDVTATSGTLANGISYDISSGSLVLTGPADGSEIDLDETISGAATLPTSVINGGNQTAYGTVSITTDSNSDVAITGDGLAQLGFTENTPIGKSGRIDLFSVLVRTEEAIRAGNIDDINGAGGSLQSQIDNLEIAANQERTQRSSLGARAARVDLAMEHQEAAQVDLEQILSRYQDADLIEVFNDIVQQETAFQAALNVTSRISDISILDYF